MSSLLSHGYPDPEYLDRLESQLKNLGIDESQLPTQPALHSSLKKDVLHPTSSDGGTEEAHVQPATGNVKLVIDKKKDLSGFEGSGHPGVDL